MGTYNIFAYDSSNIVPIVPASDDVANVPGDLTVQGNMTVAGDVVTTNTAVSLVQDNMLHLSYNYETDNAALEGGLVISVEAFTNNSGSAGTHEQIRGSVNAVNISGAQTLAVTGDFDAAFDADDIIQIQDAEDAENNGLYQIHSVSVGGGSTTIVVKGAGGQSPDPKVATFVSTSLSTNSSDSTIKIHKVKVGVLRSNSTSGSFESAFGSSVSSLSYSSLDSVAADDISTGDAAVNLVTSSGNVLVDSQAGTTTIDGHTGVTIQSTNANTHITLDAAGDVNIDADSGDINLKDGGTQFGTLSNSSSDFVISSNVQDKDIKFQGNDGGSGVTALTLDMSAAGAAAFNSTVSATDFTATGSFIIGSASMNEADLEKLDGITNGTVAASKAVVVDSNLDASGFRNVTASGSFIIGNASMNEADLEKIDGITAGTAAALKALVVDANLDIGTIRNLTSSGVVTAAGFTIGSAVINEAELEQIDGITAGTVAASKAVVVDSNKDASGFRNISATQVSTGTTVVTDDSIVMTPSTDDTATIAAATNGVLNITTVDTAAAAADINLTADGKISLDAADEINLDATGDINLKDGGSQYGTISQSSSDFVVSVNTQDKDFIIQGNDGGSGINALTLDMSAGGAATFTGSITCATSLTIGSAAMSEADLEQLDGITAGTAAASKALVLDSNKDIGTIRNLTIDGVFTDGNYTFDTSGNVSGLGTVGCGAITSSGNLAVTGTITGDTSLTLDSTTITTAEIGVLDSVTAGTAAASKALVLDANKDIGTIRNLTINGVFTDGNYTFDTSGNVSGLGTVGCGAITTTGNVKLTANKAIGYDFQSDAAHDIGNILYFKSDGDVAKASAGALSTGRPVGVALESASTGGEDKMVATVFGSIVDVKFNSPESFNRGVAIYLDPSNAGCATKTAPTGSGQVIFRLGYAIEEGTGSDALRQIIFQPEFLGING